MLSTADKQDIIRKTWQLQSVPEVPFLVEIGTFHAATSAFYGDDQAELDWNIAYHQQRSAVDDYGMPNLKPNLGIQIVAQAFGCACTPNDEADPWAKPLITDDNIQDVHTLAMPDVATSPVFARGYERLEYFQQRSALPLRLINVPSPLVTASLLWEYTSFIQATVLFPAEVHALLEKVTHVTIGYIQEQLRRIRNLHTMGHEMWYIPREVGVRVSDDTAVLLSPDLYRQFGVKYNSMISRALGGIVVHSCGDVQNVVAAMMEIEGLRGLDLTIPQNSRWDVIRDAAGGKTALNLRHFYWDHAQEVDLVAYTRKLIDCFGRRGVFIQTGAKTPEQAADLAGHLHTLLGR